MTLLFPPCFLPLFGSPLARPGDCVAGFTSQRRRRAARRARCGDGGRCWCQHTKCSRSGTRSPAATNPLPPRLARRPHACTGCASLATRPCSLSSPRLFCLRRPPLLFSSVSPVFSCLVGWLLDLHRRQSVLRRGGGVRGVSQSGAAAVSLAAASRPCCLLLAQC